MAHIVNPAISWIRDGGTTETLITTISPASIPSSMDNCPFDVLTWFANMDTSANRTQVFDRLKVVFNLRGTSSNSNGEIRIGGSNASAVCRQGIEIKTGSISQLNQDVSSFYLYFNDNTGVTTVLDLYPMGDTSHMTNLVDNWNRVGLTSLNLGVAVVNDKGGHFYQSSWFRLENLTNKTPQLWAPNVTLDASDTSTYNIKVFGIKYAR